MDISASNYSTINPREALIKFDDSDLRSVLEKTDSLNDKNVVSEDVKDPVAVFSSVALAALGVYAIAKGSAKKITNTFPGLASKVEGTLSKASTVAKSGAKALRVDNPTTKVEKAKDFAGKVIDTVDDKAVAAYKKVAYRGLSPYSQESRALYKKVRDEAVKNGKTIEEARNIAKKVLKDKLASQALTNAVGLGAGGVALAEICKRDSNEDGLNDIMQKSQNVYTGAKNTCNSSLATINALSSIMEVVA